MAKADNSGLKLIERLRSDSERQLNFRPPDDASNDDEYAGVGALLRHTREQHGLDLFSVGSVLRIQVSHLDAIESGNFKRLPGATYAVGFLRSYADYLGLDTDMVVQRFKEETEIAPAQTRLVFPEPVEETRRPGLRTALVTVLMAAAIYGGWIYLERHSQPPLEIVSEPPQRFGSQVDAGDGASPAPQPTTVLPVPSVGGTQSALADSTSTETSTPPAGEERLALADDAVDAGNTPALPSVSAENTPLEPSETAGSDGAAQGLATAAGAASTPAAAADGASTESAANASVPAATADAAPAQPNAVSPTGAMTPSQTATGLDTERTAAVATPPADARLAPAPTPTRVQVTPVETEEAIARADAAAEERRSEGSASPVEQAAAADVASMERQPAAMQGTPVATAGSDQTGNDTANGVVVVPALKPDLKTETAASASASASNTPADAGASSSSPVAAPVSGAGGNTANSTAASAAAPIAATQDEEDGAPAIPQIQARLEPPKPPVIPAAPPPAPRLAAAVAGDQPAGTVSDTPTPRYQPQIYGVSTAKARVVVRALADSWVQVQGADNELLLTRILRAGDTYYAPDRSDLVLMTGNAGAIEVVVDGQVLGTLGPVGAVRRNIGLHADALQSFVQQRRNANR